jgi:hypothetical protein
MRSSQPDCRKDKYIVSAYVPARDALTLRHLVGKLSVERGRHVTIQNVVCEMMADYFARHGETPTQELIEGVGPTPRKPRKIAPAPSS